MNMLKFKTKTKIARHFVNTFHTNVLKSITFLHPMGVCAWVDFTKNKEEKTGNISILYIVSICQVSRYFMLCKVFDVSKKGLKYEECLRHTQYFKENGDW